MREKDLPWSFYKLNEGGYVKKKTLVFEVSNSPQNRHPEDDDFG